MNRAFQVMILAAVAMGSRAQARVFSYKDSSVAPFIRSGMVFSHVNQDAFAHSSGASTHFGDESSKYSFNGELGVQFSMGPFNLRLGVEALQPLAVNATGEKSNGTDLMTVTSEIFSYGPKATIEYIYGVWGNFRFYGYVAGSYMIVTLDNTYSLTTGAGGGTATYPTVDADYKEQGNGRAVSLEGGTGFEVLFADNVTFSLDAGYRHFPVTSLEYNHDYTTFDGDVSEGRTMKNQDSSTRKLDLGGLMVNAAFRFYLNF